ncbi:MAG: hypothetical protein SGJ16_13870 [Nitrospirota bacterium]|nr:hypothetical protein [Nitrospirota bacterium]
MDTRKLAEKWAQKEAAIASALIAYRKGNRGPLLTLFDSYSTGLRRVLPRSLQVGLRAVLEKKKGAPATRGPAQRFERRNMAIMVKIYRTHGYSLEVAVEKVAKSFDTSDGIVKHAFLAHFPAPRARSGKR